MNELLIEIDTLLARLEDFTHGKDGQDITKLRGKIQQVIESEIKITPPHQNEKKRGKPANASM